MKCPVCGENMKSTVCVCGYDVSRDFETHPALGLLPGGVVSVAAMRARRKSLIRCGGCGNHGFSLNYQEGKLCCLRCGRALTEGELKPLAEALGLKKPEKKPEPKQEKKPEPKAEKKPEKVQPAEKPDAAKQAAVGELLKVLKKQEAPKGNPKRIVEIAAGHGHIVYLHADGTVKAQGDNAEGQCDVGAWTDITAIAAGAVHTVGLKRDGTVVAVGDESYGRCGVEQWKNIRAIAAGLRHTVGLKNDGTVVAVGDNSFGQCKVTGWRNIQAIAACDKQTIALKRGGTVAATGFNKDGRCDVSGWIKVSAIAAGTNTTVGLLADGTVVSAGVEKPENVRDMTAIGACDHILGLRKDGTVAVLAGGGDKCNVRDWKEITAIAAGKGFSVGLKADGTLVFSDSSILAEAPKKVEKTESCAPGIIAIAAGLEASACVRTDGTVRVVGSQFDPPPAAVKGWKDPIQQIMLEHRDVTAVSLSRFFGYCDMAILKKDGTVVATKKNRTGVRDIWTEVNAWRNITSISMGAYHLAGLRKDGTVVIADITGVKWNKVSSWRDIIAVSAGKNHVVGLKRDGTVVADGGNSRGDECYVSHWRNIVAVSAGDEYTVGLKQNGTVVAVGKSRYGQGLVSGWNDIVAISAGDGHTVGLKKDGTVVATSHDIFGECQVPDWRDIQAISAGHRHTIGLKKDGTMVAVGSNYDGQCDVHELVRK